MINKLRKNRWLAKFIILFELVIFSVMQIIIVDSDGISLLFGRIWISKNDVLLICVIILYTCLSIFILYLSKYIDYKRVGKRRKKAPYEFFLPDEFLIYRNVGIANKKIKDEDVLVFYSDWKNRILEKYGKYDLDFVKYLNRFYRYDLLYLEAIKTVMIPILVGFVAIYCNGMPGLYSIICGLVCAITLVIICCKEMTETNDRIGLYKDVMDIMENRIVTEMNNKAV